MRPSALILAAILTCIVLLFCYVPVTECGKKKRRQLLTALLLALLLKKRKKIIPLPIPLPIPIGITRETNDYVKVEHSAPYAVGYDEGGYSGSAGGY